MLPRRWMWMVAGAIILTVATVCNWPAPKEKPNTQLIDYLQQRSDSLQKANVALTAEVKQLAQSRDSIARIRNAVKAVSDSARRDLKKQVVALPPHVPDSLLAVMYDHAQDLVRQLWDDNQRLYMVTVYDSVMLTQTYKMVERDSLVIAHMQEELDNTVLQRDDWHAKYDTLNNEHHAKCGAKCGAVLGVLGFVAGKWAWNKLRK